MAVDFKIEYPKEQEDDGVFRYTRKFFVKDLFNPKNIFSKYFF